MQFDEPYGSEFVKFELLDVAVSFKGGWKVREKPNILKIFYPELFFYFSWKEVFAL